MVGMAILHVHQKRGSVKCCSAGTVAGERGAGSVWNRKKWWITGSLRLVEVRMDELGLAEMYIASPFMIRHFDLTIDGTTAEDIWLAGMYCSLLSNRHLHAWCRPVGSGKV